MGRIAFSAFTFSSRKCSADRVTGGSIATRAQQLQQVALDHVAQRAGSLIIIGPTLYP